MEQISVSNVALVMALTAVAKEFLPWFTGKRTLILSLILSAVVQFIFPLIPYEYLGMVFAILGVTIAPGAYSVGKGVAKSAATILQI